MPDLRRLLHAQSNAGHYDQYGIMHHAIPARLVHDLADGVGPNPEISRREKIVAGRQYPFPKGANDKPWREVAACRPSSRTRPGKAVASSRLSNTACPSGNRSSILPSE
jgi:hypothetical protein